MNKSNEFDSTIPKVVEVDIYSNQHRISAFVVNVNGNYLGELNNFVDYKSARIFRNQDFAHNVASTYKGKVEIVDLSYICTNLFLKPNEP